MSSSNISQPSQFAISSQPSQWEIASVDPDTSRLLLEQQHSEYIKFLHRFSGQTRDSASVYRSNGSFSADAGAFITPVFPLKLDSVAQEQTTILELVHTDNRVFNKVIATLTTLCTEVSQLDHEANTQYYPALQLYGETGWGGEHSPTAVSASAVEADATRAQSGASSNGPGAASESGLAGAAAPVLSVARTLPLLQRLRLFVAHAERVLRHILWQLAALLTPPAPPQAQSRSSQTQTPQKRTLVDLTDVHLQSVFKSIGDLLRIFITLDVIILHQFRLSDQWAIYKRMLNTVHFNLSMFPNVTVESLTQLETLVRDLDYSLFSGRIFVNALSSGFDDSKDKPAAAARGQPAAPSISPAKCMRLSEELLYCVREWAATLDTRLECPLAVSACGSAAWATPPSALGGAVGSMAELEVAAGTASLAESRLGFQLLSTYSLFVLHYYIFRITPDKKLFRLVSQLHAKMPCVCLVGTSIWRPAEFLLRTLPNADKVADKRVAPLINARGAAAAKQLEEFFNSPIVAYLQRKMATLNRDVPSCEQQVLHWALALDHDVGFFASVSAAVTGASDSSTSGDGNSSLRNDIATRLRLFLQGLHLAEAIGTNVRTILALHTHLQKALTKSTALLIFRLIELLKAIESEYERHSVLFAQSMIPLFNLLQLQMLSSLNLVSKRLASETRQMSTRMVDQLSAVKLAETMFNGPATSLRRLIADISIDFFHTAVVIRQFTSEGIDASFAYAKFRLTVEHNRELCELQTRVRAACNTSFLVAYPLLAEMQFALISSVPLFARRLQHVLNALGDCVEDMRVVAHLENPSALIESHRRGVIDFLEKNLLRPLTTEVENGLRLLIHSHLRVTAEQTNPLNNNRLVDWMHFFRLPPLRFLDVVVHIKSYVEYALSRTFYQLTTVALHDWRSYGEMSERARQVLGLELLDSQLPTQTLEQGLDILNIMRNIHIFVAHYNYNLNNQVFIEKTSNNKHLNTIGIKHVANSIRTHGVGIMNTTVNFTYQFMRRKLFIFSQFMYDEHIKARLVKDSRALRAAVSGQQQQQRQEGAQERYSFERAEKWNRNIRKLGVNPDGESYLDQFRALITQIGNALGYVRMIRSGGLHCLYNELRFIPDLDDKPCFEELVKIDQLSPSTVAAAGQVDEVQRQLEKTFTEGSEYLRLLIAVFAPEFRNLQKNLHLKNFYLIVPPLTVNFVEHMVATKEKLSKGAKGLARGAAFTDDGFAMGVAYILKLLDQYSDMDSLHWFSTVGQKYKRERQEVEKQKALAAANSSTADEKLLNTLQLTLKRLDLYEREFMLLYFSLSSARIFFRYDAPDPTAGPGVANVTSGQSEASGTSGSGNAS